MARKLDLIIDYSNVSFKAMHTCAYLGEGDIKNFDSSEECRILAKKLSMDVAYIIKMFSPNSVILACDSKNPWRCDIFKEIDGLEYKGTRQHKEGINLKNVFGVFSEVRKSLESLGCIVTEIDRAEADDVASMWKRKLYAEGNDNVVFASSDRDWTQLIEFDKDSKKFCICYNPVTDNKGHRKLRITQDILDWIESEDNLGVFFSIGGDDKMRLKNIMKYDQKCIYEIINPHKVLIDKILCGDDGDNIPAFFDYYKNGRKMRVTPLKASHICDRLNVKNVSNLVDEVSSGRLCEEMSSEMKYEIDIDFNDRIDRQRKLVELNESLFPVTITESFDSFFESCEIYSKQFVSHDVSYESILENTKYKSNDFKNMRKNSIFDQIIDVDKYFKKF